MLRHRWLLAVLLSSLLSVWLVVVAGRLVWSRPAPSTVYSLAVLRALLERAPVHWLGRTVVVRALAAPCPWWGAAARLQHCAGQPLVLVGTATDAPTGPLPLACPAPSPLWTVLRRLPWLGDMLPQPTLVVDPLVPARYRVRLLVLPAGAGPGVYAALPLAVTPLARPEG
jgi:hypothetical protein